VTADNSSGKLLPYLTANVQFEMGQRSDVLLVPNAALRWRPQASQIDPVLSKTALSAESTNTQDRGCLWVEANGGFVRPLAVVVGVSDGTMTEISGNGVKEGMQVIVGEEGQGDTEGQDNETPADGDKTSNPFLPKPPKGSRPPPGPM
jgi:HlyD family secretion protein